MQTLSLIFTALTVVLIGFNIWYLITVINERKSDKKDLDGSE